MKRPKRRSTWLLTIATAYAVLPGCGDDDTSNPAGYTVDAGIVARPPDASVNTFDAGVVARPPDASIAVGLMLPPRDASVAVGLVLPPPGADSGVMGLMIIPRDDAGIDASIKSPDAGPFIVGLIAVSVKDS
jgi:hypothetical protein